MADYQVLYWRDIPAQIKVYDGRRPRSHQLPERFQVEIDRVAMAEGLAGTEDYLAQWTWTERREREGDPDAVARALIEELAAAFDER